MLELSWPETTSRAAKLEGPEEVGSLLEVRSDGIDLVDQVLHADDAKLAEVLFDDGVVGKRDPLLVDLAVAALVDELADGFEVGVSVGNPRLDDLEHLVGGFGHAHKDTVVDLEETEQLENLPRLWCDFVDTAKVNLV